MFVLNVLWAGMMLVGILWGAFCGNLDAVTNGMLETTKDAVTLGITMLGIMSFWCGILKIAEESSLIEAMTEKMRPIIRFLFPNLPEDHPAAVHLATNMIANFLGLGGAATPAGLRAMKELEKLEEERRSLVRADEHTGAGEPDGGWRKRTAGRLAGQPIRPVPRGTASHEMCTFLIINISSLQLVPINMIAYRSQYGSANPTAIVGPAFLATAVSTAAAVVYCKMKRR